MLRKLRERLQSYKYRSVPWLLWNWKRRPIKQVSYIGDDDTIKQDDKFLNTLAKFFNKLSALKETETAKTVMQHELGFVIGKQLSNIKNGGTGVFVTDGFVQKGDLVALYPGAVYYPMEPILFQSFFNMFILKCFDGMLIDGKNSGISKYIFKSCASRDRIGSHPLCDSSWLNDNKDFENPLSIGQYVNNETLMHPANVMYQELDIPVSFKLSYMKYIPNVNYNPPVFLKCENINFGEVQLVRTVVLKALKDIHRGEELFSTYHTEVTTTK